MGCWRAAPAWKVVAFAPPPTRAQLVEGLARGSAAYAALGVGTIREAMIDLGEFLAYQDAAEQGKLSVRVRPLIRVGNELTADAAIAMIDGLGARSGFGDDWLRLWGLKFVMDGGVEGGALEQPLRQRPAQLRAPELGSGGHDPGVHRSGPPRLADRHPRRRRPGGAHRAGRL
jgi:predicted amidohydrolase YtcJ